MAGQKGMRPAPESRGGDHPAGRRTGITDRGGIIMPMIPPLSYRPPKAAVQGVLMRERRQPPPLADAFMLCAHQTMPSPHGRARRGDGEERQIERGGPALRLGGDGRREQCKADDGVDGFSDGLHGGLLFLRCPRHASRRRRGRTGVLTARSGVQPRFRRLETTLAGMPVRSDHSWMASVSPPTVTVLAVRFDRTGRDKHRVPGLPSVLQAPDKRFDGHAASAGPFLHRAGASAHGRFRSLILDILPRMNAGDSRISRFGFLFATTRQEGRGR